MSTLENPNASVLLDMNFLELEGVDEDYDNPTSVREIKWITENASYSHKDNGVSGVYDFIFNLAMLESYAQEGDAPEHLVEQLKDIRSQGYTYILFNQGC